MPELQVPIAEPPVPGPILTAIGGVGAPEARRLLQHAQGLLQKWPETFRGFEATLRCGQAPSPVPGAVRVARSGMVEVDLPDPELRGWIEAWLRTTSEARTPRFFKNADGRFPISFEARSRPGYQTIRVDRGAGGWRRYWIDDKGRIRREESRAGDRYAVRTLDDYVKTTPGRVLPTRSSGVEWDVVSETLPEFVALQEVHCRIEHVWLPRAVRMIRRWREVQREVHVALERHTLG